MSAPPAPTNPTGLVVLPSHLQQVHAAPIADRVGIESHVVAELRTAEDYQRFIDEHA